MSERLNAGDVMVVDDLKLDAPKTSEFVALLKTLGLEGSALVVTAAQEQNLNLAARNVPKVLVTTSDMVHTYQVLHPDKLLFTRSAFEKLEARLKN